MATPKNNPVLNRAFPHGTSATRADDKEMVCGKCGPIDHELYIISLTHSHQIECDPEKIKGSECAVCSGCGDMRPVNMPGNELLYQLKLIPTSEYLSWADNSQ